LAGIAIFTQELKTQQAFHTSHLHSQFTPSFVW